MFTISKLLYDNRYYIEAGGNDYLFSDGVIRDWEEAINTLGQRQRERLVYFSSRESAHACIDNYNKKTKKPDKKYQYDYPMAGLTADCILLRKNSDNELFVLLIKRGGEPYKDRLALPGGFVEIDKETLKEACIREIREEISVILFNTQIDFFKMADKIDRDPRGRTISAIFSANLDDKQVKQVQAGDDAAGFVWVPFCEEVISNLNLAFDHQEILLSFLQKKG